ncbi:MAG: 2'-5' RNA ligase family protein [Thaumarchaeota archaeon]|nr:2'-5' RNA ligase family protein [Nitrososphaerota archaeon]
MPHENRYFIEYGICGKLNSDLMLIQKELMRKFPYFDNYDDQEFHITIVPPINEKIAKEFILESIREELKSIRVVEFKVKNYDYFDNEDGKPIFLKVGFDKNFNTFREKLIARLRRKVEIVNKFEQDGFNPHIALGFVKDKEDAKEIVDYLNNKYSMKMRQIFDRMSILNGNRILWEYDVFNKKTITGTETLRNKRRLDNIRRIIDFKNRIKNNIIK